MGREDEIAKLREMIGEIRFAMLTTIEDDGSLRSRPMAAQQTEGDADLWFFTYGGSPKAQEVRRDDRVNVSFSDNDKNRWVSVSGNAELVRDRAKMEELWKPILKAWFPQGLDEPDIALLKVDVEQAEYWDSASSKMVHLVGLVKAVANGELFQPGDDVKLDFATA
ncbi:MAG: pyridoxamine 5'-phosphate oxidase family protein [Chloroflexota bacterium]|nr:pyridoxamine 5'-phosphate oxidase family protein [Chloroflexota bacterium]